MKTLSIHLTDLCNSKCSFCVVGSPLFQQNSVDFAHVTRFLRDNANKGFTSVNLHGGEATTHPHFMEVVDLAYDLGYPEIHLQTNALKLSNRAFAAELVKRRVNLFIVSLHGDTATLQDGLTATEGGFARTIEGIRNVVALGSRVRTNTVITRQNLERLTQIAQLACQLGVGHLNFSNIHPVGSTAFSFDSVVPKLSDIISPLKDAVALAKNLERVVTLEGFPYCVVGSLSSYQLNESARNIRMLMRGRIIEDYDAFMSDCCRHFGAVCTQCSVREKCGGVYPEYTERFGWDEFHAISEHPEYDVPRRQTAL